MTTPHAEPGLKRIRFSHNYSKMFHDGTLFRKAKLLEVFHTHTTSLHKDFIDYDTEYPFGHYQLPKSEIIILLLLTDGHLWTTIRRYTPQKFNYYKRSRGEEFEIIIEE